MRQYNEELDKTIIKVLFQNGESTYGKLKKEVEDCLKHTISFETFSDRLNSMINPSIKQSRYAIQPVLQKLDEGRGKKVFYSLNKYAKIRYSLQLPILKIESKIEKAYRLLFYYIVFYYTPSIKLKDDYEYIALLEKVGIGKNELEFVGNSVFDEFIITKWNHAKSEIEFSCKDNLKSSGKEANYEFSYILPGISPTDFQQISGHGIPYQQLKLTKEEVLQCFKLLEKHNLIKIIPYHLEFLNQERYTLVDNELKELLSDCRNLQSHVFTYLEYIWQSLSKPTNKEKIWLEHLWGKNKSNKWFTYCYDIRKEYQKKNKNQLLQETQERIDWVKSEIRKTFNSIKEKYSKTIEDYSYFIIPLLNVVYPQFLRKEFN